MVTTKQINTHTYFNVQNRVIEFILKITNTFAHSHLRIYRMSILVVLKGVQSSNLHLVKILSIFLNCQILKCLIKVHPL
jgi:hypothetical protein